MSNTYGVTILLVEDDPGHARLIVKNLRRAGITNQIVILEDGQKALDCLFGEGEYASQRPTEPFLVLLDLNLPVLDGYQVLERLKSDKRTLHIPVFVLTTTDDPQEIRRCYEMGCNVYVIKPVEYTRLSEAIQRLGLFLGVVTLPVTK